MKKSAVGLSLAILITGAFAIQYHSICGLRSELAAVRRLLNSPVAASNQSAARDEADAGSLSKRGHSSANAQFAERLAALEDAVALLNTESEQLMQRGQIALSLAKRDEMSRQFLDATASNQSRLQALRLLRRNQPFSAEVVQAAFAWVQSSTNADLSARILRQMNGATNSLLRDPLLGLAADNSNAGIRQQAIVNLQAFIAEPPVEEFLWKTLVNDPNSDVRDAASQALSDAPANEERLAALQQRALNDKASLDERLTAFQAMQQADTDVGEVAAVFANAAATAENPADKAKIYSALAGLDDSALLPTLVQGLQDPSPEVRLQAARSLNGYQLAPAGQQWLQYVANSDPDPLVRRAATRTLAQNSN